MKLEFKKISEFNRGITYDLLVNAYSFNIDYVNDGMEKWRGDDDFFFDNLDIADSCGFITVLDSEPIGL